MKAHLLYVEDDESLSFVTRDNLLIQGYEVTHYANGNEAMEAVKTHKFDLCILDVMLPDTDGFTIAEAIRKGDSEVPILFLTAKSLKEDRIHGLQLGADDYITKPFSIEELVLKIEIFLKRRYFSNPSQNDRIAIGHFEFDPANLCLYHEEETRNLTQREADLLLLLVKNRNEVLKRSDILERIWGQDDYFLGRSLDVFVSRLRKYLKADERIKIENIHGVGFRLRDERGG